MIGTKMEKAINDQINAELYSSYLYLSMSTDLSEKGYSGFANWMRVQAKEEDFHGMKLFDYLEERGGRVVLTEIAAPPTEWDGVIDTMKAVYAHEVHVTSLTNGLMDIEVEEKDYAAQQMLQWFIEEQVEEEATASDIVSKLEMIGEQGNGIFMLDKEMSTRVFNPPVKE